MKGRFSRGWGASREGDPEDPDMEYSLSDLDDDFEGTDEETDSDFEAMLADLQNDGDEDTFMQFIAHMQEQGIVIQMGSDDEEDEEEEDAGDETFVDAEEGVDTDWEDAEDDLEEHDADLD